jgi:hypothetical protein
MITDVIREAESEHQIYFLLTAYLEAVRYGDRLNLLPDALKRLPLTGMNDVKERFEQLFIELDSESKGLNHRACAVLKEALHVFSTAINRLDTMAGTRQVPGERRRRNRQRAAPATPPWPYPAASHEDRRLA